MNPIPEIKKFLLKSLAATGGLPVPNNMVDDWGLKALVPRPLLSDVHQAKRELERDGFISGAKDDLDETLVTWSLTQKGVHRAKQLE